MIFPLNGLQIACHVQSLHKVSPQLAIWHKMLKNSHYGTFSGSGAALFAGSILDKMMSALQSRAAECSRYVPPRRKLLVKHFPHKYSVEIPYMNAMEALDWCLEDYQDAFTLREVTGETVQFIVKTHAARVYLKTSFG